MHDACEFYGETIIELLLKTRANSNIVDEYTNETTLLIAAKRNDLKIIKLIVENGFDCDQLINFLDSDGGASVFLLLCFNGNIEALSYLIDVSTERSKITEHRRRAFNMNPMHTDCYGRNCLHLAMCGVSNPKMVFNLLKRVCFPPEKGDERTDRLRYRIGSTILNGEDGAGFRPMDYAVLSGNNDLIGTLLKYEQCQLQFGDYRLSNSSPFASKKELLDIEMYYADFAKLMPQLKLGEKNDKIENLFNKLNGLPADGAGKMNYSRSKSFVSPLLTAVVNESDLSIIGSLCNKINGSKYHESIDPVVAQMACFKGREDAVKILLTTMWHGKDMNTRKWGILQKELKKLVKIIPVQYKNKIDTILNAFGSGAPNDTSQKANVYCRKGHLMSNFKHLDMLKVCNSCGKRGGVKPSNNSTTEEHDSDSKKDDKKDGDGIYHCGKCEISSCGDCWIGEYIEYALNRDGFYSLKQQQPLIELINRFLLQNNKQKVKFIKRIVIRLCQIGNVNSLKQFLEKCEKQGNFRFEKKNVVSDKTTGNNLLHCAVLSQRPEMVKFILTHKIFNHESQLVNKVNNNQYAPIHLACTYRTEEAVHIFGLLIKHPANSDLDTQNQQRLLDIAFKNRSLLILQLMVKQYPKNVKNRKNYYDICKNVEKSKLLWGDVDLNTLEKQKQSVGIANAGAKSNDRLKIRDRWEVYAEIIGRGGFGRVRKGVDLFSGKEVAIKQSTKRKKNHDEEDDDDDEKEKAHVRKHRDMVYREYQALSRISSCDNHNTNVIRLIACDKSNNTLPFVVYEYCVYGNLGSYIRAEDGLGIDHCRFYLSQIVNGLTAIHKHGIIHRDLTPHNCLLDENFNIKISDFGLAIIMISDKDVNTWPPVAEGTNGYVAPEMFNTEDGKSLRPGVINNFKIRQACDIFSLAVILWQMVFGWKQPFYNARKDDPHYEYLFHNSDNNADVDGFWNSYGNDTNVNRYENDLAMRNLLLKMFESDPSQRISIDNIQKHSWYQKQEDTFYYKNKEAFKATMSRTHKHIPKQELQLDKTELVQEKYGLSWYKLRKP